MSEDSSDSSSLKRSHDYDQNFELFPCDINTRNIESLAATYKKICVRDSRKGIIKKIMDAFNTGNIDHLERCLRHYCSEKCVIVECFVGEFNPLCNDYLELHGIEAIIEYFNTLLSIVPDAVYELHETRMRVRPQTQENLVVSRYSFSGTKLFDYSMKQIGVNETDQFIKNSKSEKLRLANCLNVTYAPKAGKVIINTNKLDSYKFKPDIKVKGTLSMPLDNNDKVTRFEFIYSSV